MLLCRGDARLEMLPHRDKGAGIGALEAVDRLLCVANRENRAVALTPHAALAGEKLVRERFDDVPLVGVRVLRLVDQDVIEPPIELEQHPRRDARPPQEFERLHHEIVEIEEPMQSFAFFIGAQHGIPEPEQRDRRLDQHRPSALMRESQHAVRLGFEHGAGIAGCPVVGAFGNQVLPDRTLVRQERAGIIVQHVATAIRRGAPARHDQPTHLIFRRPCSERRCSDAQPRFVAGARRAECLDQLIGRDVLGHRKDRGEPRSQRDLASTERGAQFAALRGHRRQEPGKAVFLDVARDHPQRFRERWGAIVARLRNDGFGGLGQRLRGAALIEDGKLRRDAGFKRKAPQERLAKGVDRRDLGAAGTIEHAREKLARQCRLVFVRHSPDQRDELFVELAGRQCRPGGEARIDPVRHLGRRGAGKGQAEDPRRVGAVDHQGEQPIGQHLGLAGTGRGRHPHRCLGAQCLTLDRGGFPGSSHGGAAHSSSSSGSSSRRSRCW